MWGVRWAFGTQLTRKPPNSLRLAYLGVSCIGGGPVRVSDFGGEGGSMTALATNFPNGMDRSAAGDGKANPQLLPTPGALEPFG